MTRRYHKSILWLLLIALSFSLIAISVLNVVAFGDGTVERDLRILGVSVTVEGKTYTDFITDPVKHVDKSADGYLNGWQTVYYSLSPTDKVVYTARYPKPKTGRTGATEFVCELDESGSYVVNKVNTEGDTYIPVGGFVLSVGEGDRNIAKVGDKVVLDNQVEIPQKAVESSTYRVVIDSTNTTRSKPMIVYYDYQFGAKTGTNVFGTEMTCTFDFDKQTFVVSGFRGFLQGDDSGSDIPDNSFVLSAYGEGYRTLLTKTSQGDNNFTFDVGDEVKMVGFDFIRFGGTVYGTYDFVNPTPEENPKGMETSTSPFPAYRGENQTIIYKHGWNYQDSAGTGTNVYGYEAAVNSDGVVVELGVNVSAIPEGGYVISGHGVGRDFIRSNVVLGATVALDEVNKRYSVSTTLNSYYENLVTEVDSVVQQAEQRINRKYDVDVQTLQEQIEQVKAAVANLKAVKEEIEQNLASGAASETERLCALMNYNDYQLKVERLKNYITVLSADSKLVSARGVWHRPIETTYEEIEENVRTYDKVGINLIFVETLYNGYSTFKSSRGYFPYNTKLGDTYKDGDTEYPDYLTAFVAACKKYDIEVHAWVENFYVGTQNTVPIVANHADWLLYNDDGTVVQRNEGGAYIFLDPANAEVQNVLIDYYKELLQKVPDIAGLNLDYIRYPVSDRAEDTGYTIAAMQGFAESRGMTFSDAQKSDRAKMAKKFVQLFNADYLEGGEAQAQSNYDAWVTYRSDVITAYVRRIVKEVKADSGKLLSTSVFASVTDSLQAKKQDWKTWFSNGWIDIATPMAYYNNPADVRYHTENMILAAGNNCYYYTGIASSYSGLPAWENKEQIEASYLAGANGYVIFCSTQILGHEDVQQALMSGVNAQKGVLPHAALNKVLSAYFDSILDRADRLYVPSGQMTAQKRDALKAEFDKILAMDAKGAVNVHKIQSAVKALYSGSPYASGYSGQRIAQQLKELVSLLETRISVELITSGVWDAETQPRPTVTDTAITFPSTDDNPSDDPSDQPDDPNPNKDNKTDVTLIVIVVAACLVAIGTGVVLTITFIRKNKSQSK